MGTSHTRRGFTMIEAALVMAVMGIVLSGVWFSAQAVYSSILVSNASDQIQEIATRMRDLYSNPQLLLRGNDTTFNCNLVIARVFPDAMLPDASNKTTCQQVNHGWKTIAGTGSITLAAYDLAGATDVPAGSATGARSFRIRYAQVPSASCVSLITREFTADPVLQLEAIIVRGGTTTTFLSASNQVPPTPTAAGTACSNTAEPDIDFVYKR